MSGGSGSGSGGGPSRRSGVGGLGKNTTIKCTIDDLQLEQGLLVVSFTHKDNLYQGVLLQLNRERGIPAGISFPKHYFSEESKPVDQAAPPTPVPPVHQRDTYFQQVDNNGAQRSLRRSITIPARFKNSRMSLRPVQRPVLCAKCGVLCNERKQKDKESSSVTSSSGIAKTEKPKKTGESRKSQLVSNKSTAKDRVVQSPPVKSSTEHPIPSIVEDPEVDYGYVGVGSTGIVDNAWKRPLTKPLQCPTRQQSSTNKAKISSFKAVALKSRRKTGATPAQSNSSSVFRITQVPQLHNSDKKKVNNLKMCIKKLTMVQETKLGRNGTTPPRGQELKVPPVRMKIPPNFTKLKLRRRSSAIVPYRMRDKHKRSPTWRIRKISTMSDTEKDNGSDEPSELVVRDTAKTEQIVKPNLSDQTSPLLEPQIMLENIPSSLDDLTPIQSPEQFDDSQEMETEPIMPVLEPVKTPVIKITFGSSGNGVVVQIPPKNTNDASSMHHDRANEDAEAKAVRKALKKARKEAKKKKTSPIITEQTACLSSTKSALTPLTIHVNSGRQVSTSPTSETSPNGVSREPIIADSTSDSFEKKRRKSKKRKREKDHKENDVDLHSSSGESHYGVSSGPQMSSPNRNVSPSRMILHDGQADSTLPSDNETTHSRVCISLKRIKDQNNVYIPWSLNNDEHDEAASENEEPHEFQDTSFHSDPETNEVLPLPVESIECYKHEQSNCQYRKGDVIWGKSTGCPWWPGRILDIQVRANDARAKIAWYKSSTQSFIAFKDLHPFQEYFETKYTKNRKRGCYQQAVREALGDAHQINLQDLPTD